MRKDPSRLADNAGYRRRLDTPLAPDNGSSRSGLATQPPHQRPRTRKRFSSHLMAVPRRVGRCRPRVFVQVAPVATAEGDPRVVMSRVGSWRPPRDHYVII